MPARGSPGVVARWPRGPTARCACSEAESLSQFGVRLLVGSLGVQRMQEAARRQEQPRLDLEAAPLPPVFGDVATAARDAALCRPTRDRAPGCREAVGSRPFRESVESNRRARVGHHG